MSRLLDFFIWKIIHLLWNWKIVEKREHYFTKNIYNSTAIADGFDDYPNFINKSLGIQKTLQKLIKSYES